MRTFRSGQWAEFHFSEVTALQFEGELCYIHAIYFLAGVNVLW